MADRGDLAVRRCADADTLDGRRPMHGVVEHQRSCQRHLNGPTSCACAKRREQGIGSYEQLTAETAADVRRDQADILLGNAERLRQVADAPVDHLVGGPQCELVARSRRRWRHAAPSWRAPDREWCRSHRAELALRRRRRRSRQPQVSGGPPVIRSGLIAESFAAARSYLPSDREHSSTRSNCAAARACSKVSATTTAMAWW